MEIPMSAPDPLWPEQFEYISSQLKADLASAHINFTNIHHIGSTSIPALNAKPVIDILITIPATDFADGGRTLSRISQALFEGDNQPGYHYIGNGGLRERWSFKLNIRTDFNGIPMMPLRNIYVVAEEGIHHRNTLTFRDTLRDERNQDLREEYGTLKWRLASRKDFVTIWDYAVEKDQVIRKVLKRAGWADEEIDAKEGMKEKNWPDELVI